MADFDFPPDVIGLRQAYDRADTRVQDLLDAGGPELAAARAERLDAVTALYAHPWFATVDQFKAREALKAAARTAERPATSR